jgi:hypothetical protein
MDVTLKHEFKNNLNIVHSWVLLPKSKINPFYYTKIKIITLKMR